MKKLLGIIALVFGVVSLSHAGTPVEHFYMGQPPLSNTTIIKSTNTSTQVNVTMSVAPGTVSNGGSSISCRNCFTRFFVQESTNVVLNILDGGTTDYAINGIALGASGVNTLNIVEDHLGPLCFTTGNTTTFNAVVTGAFTGTANPISVTAEGYTNCGGTNNAGPMQ